MRLIYRFRNGRFAAHLFHLHRVRPWLDVAEKLDALSAATKNWLALLGAAK